MTRFLRARAMMKSSTNGSRSPYGQSSVWLAETCSGPAGVRYSRRRTNTAPGDGLSPLAEQHVRVAVDRQGAEGHVDLPPG